MKTRAAAQESLPGDIRRAAMDLLARREHSRQELAVKLCRRFDNGDTVAQQLDDLAAAGLQSDRRFCEIYVRAKYQQGQGPQRISQELKQRGVDDALVAKLVWEADIDWLASLQHLYQRKYPEKTVQDQKERAKRMRFLQYRGFGFDLIRQLMAGD